MPHPELQCWLFLCLARAESPRRGRSSGVLPRQKQSC